MQGDPELLLGWGANPWGGGGPTQYFNININVKDFLSWAYE